MHFPEPRPRFRLILALLPALAALGCNSNESLDTYCRGNPCPDYFTSAEKLKADAEEQVKRLGKCEAVQGTCGEYRFLVVRGVAGMAREYFDGEGTLVAAIHPLGQGERKFGQEMKCKLLESKDICNSVLDDMSHR